MVLGAARRRRAAEGQHRSFMALEKTLPFLPARRCARLETLAARGLRAARRRWRGGPPGSFAAPAVCGLQRRTRPAPRAGTAGIASHEPGGRAPRRRANVGSPFERGGPAAHFRCPPWPPRKTAILNDHTGYAPGPRSRPRPRSSFERAPRSRGGSPCTTSTRRRRSGLSIYQRSVRTTPRASRSTRSV